VITLGIESATIEVGVALAGPSGLLAALVARPGRRHVETLHPAIEAVCAAASITLAEVGAVCVDVGPGLFTGLRVGVAAAKAVSFGLGVPVVACTSLEVLAESARDHDGPVVPVVDMRRGEVAWALAGGEARIGAVADLVGALDAASSEPGWPSGSVLLVGDGARRHARALSEALAEHGEPVPVRVAGEELGAPDVRALCRLGLRRLAAGRTTDAVGVQPCYLRPPDARANWSSRPVAGAATQPCP
jgi:tRNA threonylcarbamoyladenosine biosynthesis protein TsaB